MLVRASRATRKARWPGVLAAGAAACWGVQSSLEKVLEYGEIEPLRVSSVELASSYSTFSARAVRRTATPRPTSHLACDVRRERRVSRVACSVGCV